MKKMCFSIFVCIAFCSNILSSEKNDSSKNDPFWKEVSVANIMEMQKALREKEKENEQLRKEVIFYQQKMESLKVALEQEETYPLHH
jgi:hypothetical protein